MRRRPQPVVKFMNPIDAHHAPGDEDRLVVCRPARYGLLAFGWLNIGLGVVGMVLPVMPTTVFLLIALWAFSRCSLRFHHWLYTHPVLGRTIRHWHAHRVIPLRAKLLAVSVMGACLLYVTLFVAETWVLPSVLAAGLAVISGFIVSRPSRAVS